MIKNDRIINAIAYGDAVQKLSTTNKISISEAREIVSRMSFKEYRALEETVVPPSGQTIGPSAGGQAAQPQTGATSGKPGQIKSIWPGNGAPVEVGMTVGIKGANGLPAPGQISQVDAGSKGVKIKNPTTGQDEWANMDSLEPFMAQDGQSQNIQPGQQPVQPGQQPTAEDASSLARMRKLAGIKEDASCGATGAGAIAIAPVSMGSTKKRQATDEQLKKEYTPKEAAKTIIGDTKPHQASGELSANLAARGKKTASRTNNGFKK